MARRLRIDQQFAADLGPRSIVNLGLDIRDPEWLALVLPNNDRAAVAQNCNVRFDLIARCLSVDAERTAAGNVGHGFPSPIKAMQVRHPTRRFRLVGIPAHRYPNVVAEFTPAPPRTRKCATGLGPNIIRSKRTPGPWFS